MEILTSCAYIAIPILGLEIVKEGLLFDNVFAITLATRSVL